MYRRCSRKLKKEARDKFNQMDLKKFGDIVHIYFDEDDLDQIREEKPARINILDTDKESVVEPDSFPETMKYKWEGKSSRVSIQPIAQDAIRAPSTDQRRDFLISRSSWRELPLNPHAAWESS